MAMPYNCLIFLKLMLKLKACTRHYYSIKFFSFFFEENFEMYFFNNFCIIIVIKTKGEDDA